MQKFEVPEEQKPIRITEAQRKYLETKVRENCDRQYRKLQLSRPKQPDLNTYLLQATMTGTLRIKPAEHIISSVQKRVAEFTYGDKLVSRSSYGDEPQATFDAIDVFEIPEEYNIAMEQFKIKTAEIATAMDALLTAAETVCTKIRVGGIGSLQTLLKDIGEVGGELSLNSTATSMLLLGE